MMEFGDQLRRSQQLAVTRTEELHLLVRTHAFLRTFLSFPSFLTFFWRRNVWQLGTQADTRALLPVTASRFVVGVPPHAEALVTDEQAAAELSHNQDPVIVEWDPPSTAHPVPHSISRTLSLECVECVECSLAPW